MDEHVVRGTLGELAQALQAFVEAVNPVSQALRRLTEAGYEIRMLVTADRNGEIGQGPACLVELTAADDSEGSRAEDQADPRAIVEEFLNRLE
ncbi:MAG: hypothetical protein ACE5JN_11205 [Candidatus Methylomirabilia bacterium]